MEAEFTDQELIGELLSVGRDDAPAEGAMTTRALIAVTGWSARKVARALRDLQSRGLLETIRINYTRLDGVQTRIPAYRLKTTHEPGDAARNN